MRDPIYSVVIPVFNEEQTLGEFYESITTVMDKTGEEYELIFVNDGSIDRTFQIISQKCEKNPCVRMINFSRNFGHQVAITAGTDYASGHAIIIIDADLQDPPEVILDMIVLWKQGYKVIYGQRMKRLGETWFKKTTAALFYRILNLLSTVSIPLDVGDFRLIDRVVANALKEMRERHRFVRGLVSWLGFKQTSVKYIREERFAGKTKYPLSKMLLFATNAIVSFSYKPLRFATYLGLMTSFSSFVYILIIVYQKVFSHDLVPGWASLMAIILFFNGMILLILGIIGEYLGQIFSECKQRPLYVIESLLGWKSDKTKNPNE